MPDKNTIAKCLTSTILMIRPANFGYNPETAQNNSFQKIDEKLSKEEIKSYAIEEFENFVAKMSSVGIDIIVVDDTIEPIKTDAIFPNNWISTHQNGWTVTYPMFSPTRRLERRHDIIKQLSQRFEVSHHLDLSGSEFEDKFLEGTGSMVLDRQHKMVYACISERTDGELVERFCQAFDYQKIVFHSFDHKNIPIYHTNVMMALGLDFVIICMESVPNERDQNILLKSFADRNKKVIPISMKQMQAFAGNMLQVRNKQNESFLVMSSQAYESLTPEQISQLEKHTQLLHSKLNTVETSSGGSARCMMAEIFLPERN